MADVSQVIDTNGYPAPLGYLKTSATQKLDGTAVAATTTVFSTTNPVAVLISAAESFHIEIGSNPTATTNSTFLPAGLYETGLWPNFKVSIIKSSAATAGNVWVTPYFGKVIT